MAESMPFQPSLGYRFPKGEFGAKKEVSMSCQALWFQEFPLLHYNALVYCHVYMEAVTKRLIMLSKKPDASFITKGYFH